MCFLWHHHCWILGSSCIPACSNSYLVLLLSVIWTHPVMYMKPVGICYKAWVWYSWEHRHGSRIRTNTNLPFLGWSLKRMWGISLKVRENTKEHTPFSKSWRWFNDFQCWDTFQSIMITGETAATDYVTYKRTDYNLESNECRKCLHTKGDD